MPCASLRGAAAIAIPTTMLLTGVLVVLRLLPWTPPEHAITGPYVVASAQERSMAATVVATTDNRAVFLTSGRPNDPLLAVAGRTGLMGYYGWLWSYGTDFGTRFNDVRTLAKSMLYELHDGIARLPGSTEVRKLLVTRALQYLDALDKESTGETALRIELAAAYKRVGDVQGNSSLPNLGDSQGALTSYSRARQILESVLSRQPGRADAHRALAGVYFGISGVQTFLRKYPEARQRFSRQGLQDAILGR